MVKKKLGYLFLMVVPFLLGCSMYWNSPRTVEVEIKPVVVEEPVEEKEFNYVFKKII